MRRSFRYLHSMLSPMIPCSLHAAAAGSDSPMLTPPGWLLMLQMLWAHRRALLAAGPAGVRDAVSALLCGTKGAYSRDTIKHVCTETVQISSEPVRRGIGAGTGADASGICSIACPPSAAYGGVSRGMLGLPKASR